MTDAPLEDKIAAVLTEHFSHEGGMSFDADELITVMTGLLAFHLALMPAMKDRGFRKKVCRDIADNLNAMIVDAGRDLDESGMTKGVTTTPIHRTAQ